MKRNPSIGVFAVAALALLWLAGTASAQVTSATWKR